MPTKEEKQSAYVQAYEMVKAYGPNGAAKYYPPDMLRDFYDKILEIKEDVKKG